MFELKDLSQFSLEADFSKYLPLKETAPVLPTQMLKKINLKMLKTTSFGDVRVAFGELEELFPRIEYSETFGQHRVEIRIFKKKMRLEMRKTRSIKIGPKAPETEKKEQEILTSEDLENIGIDFNFIFGKVLGILKVEGTPNISTRLVFIKKEKVLPSKKLQVLNENISIILANPKTNIVGFNISFFDDKNIEHFLEFSQSKEKFSFVDDFEFEPSGPIVLLDIFENGLKLGNEICGKIFEV